jgi:hypothetical protein
VQYGDVAVRSCPAGRKPTLHCDWEFLPYWCAVWRCDCQFLHGWQEVPRVLWMGVPDFMMGSSACDATAAGAVGYSASFGCCFLRSTAALSVQKRLVLLVWLLCC